MERRLAAILAADVVGYSRLMEADEEATARTLSTYREIIEELVASHHGRVFGSAGDSVIAEFASPVEAVRCAVDIQRELEAHGVDLPEDRRMRLRIGVNLGDVMVEGDNLLGDGVNIAARLETLADPGGISLARSVFDQVRKQLDLGYEYLGEHEVKNIAEPVQVYRVLTAPEAAGKIIGEAKRATQSWKRVALVATMVVLVGVAGAVTWLRPWEPTIEPALLENMAFPLPDKPSIAVLPFTNMSGDPEQEYFADGMTDDLITDLSKVSDLFVIARNSVFTYKGNPVKVRQVAEELGVRYVLEGSVRRAGDQVRVNAQLIDATTGGHLWAERYDGSLSEIFTVQDKFVGKIVDALALNLSAEEREEIDRGQTDSIEAREAFQRGWEHYLQFSPVQNANAATEFKQAIELDPDYGRAYAALGLVYLRGCAWRWTEPLNMSRRAAFRTAGQYLDKTKNHPSSLANVAASQIYLYDERHDQALTEAARAIALDPNDPEAYIGMAWTMITTGKPQPGLEFVDTAMRLNPSYPAHYVLARGIALFAVYELERAVAIFEKALERDPGATELAPPLAATYAHLGRRQDAREALLLWKPGASQFELDEVSLIYHIPFPWSPDDREVMDRLIDGLVLAALPLDVTVPALMITLKEGEFFARLHAARTLGRFGPLAEEAVPALIEALADEEEAMRKEAVFTLEKIGPGARAAIPALTALLDQSIIGEYAKGALKKITGR